MQPQWMWLVVRSAGDEGSGNMDCCKGECQGSLKNRLKRLYDMGFHHPSAVRSATHTGRVANTPRSPTRNTSWDASW